MSGWLVATSLEFSASYLEHNHALNSFAYWAATPQHATVFDLERAIGLATVHRGLVIPDPLGREPRVIDGRSDGKQAVCPPSDDASGRMGATTVDRTFRARLRDAMENH